MSAAVLAEVRQAISHMYEKMSDESLCSDGNLTRHVLSSASPSLLPRPIRFDIACCRRRVLPHYIVYIFPSNQISGLR